MNRKEFLGTMFAISGATMAAGTPFMYMGRADTEKVSRRKKGKMDPSKVVLLSDIHICGELVNGMSKHYPYNPTCLKKCVEQILQMRPLPAHVMIFGDVAWDHGLEEDYRYAAQLLSPLKDADIEITIGLGNHDRRKTFLKVFPEYVERTRVKGRVVSVVNLPAVDLVMLDSLAELPNLKPREGTTVSGELDGAQVEWLKTFLDAQQRPVILCAHHPMNEMPVLTELITKYPTVIGYIYGHIHIWEKRANIIRPRAPQRMVATLGLPSTFYGDIGYAVLECHEDCVRVEYSSQGFWWPQPVDNPPKEWALRQKDLAHEQCSFVLEPVPK